MRTVYLVINIYNPFNAEAITDNKGLTRKFTKKQAEKFVKENYGHLTPYTIIEIKED